MKTILFIFLLASSFSFSQEYEIMKRRTTTTSICSILSDGKWSPWTKETPIDVLITLDFNASTIKIYTKNTQVYDILNYSNIKETETSMTFQCIDSKGRECNITFGQNSVVVQYPSFMMGYGTYNL